MEGPQPGIHTICVKSKPFFSFFSVYEGILYIVHFLAYFTCWGTGILIWGIFEGYLLQSSSLNTNLT